MKHPIQPLADNDKGVLRFKANKIEGYLTMEFSAEGFMKGGFSEKEVEGLLNYLKKTSGREDLIEYQKEIEKRYPRQNATPPKPPPQK